jgi:hypothetical protein
LRYASVVARVLKRRAATEKNLRETEENVRNIGGALQGPPARHWDEQPRLHASPELARRAMNGCSAG